MNRIRVSSLFISLLIIILSSVGFSQPISNFLRVESHTYFKPADTADLNLEFYDKCEKTDFAIFELDTREEVVKKILEEKRSRSFDVIEKKEGYIIKYCNLNKQWSEKLLFDTAQSLFYNAKQIKIALPKKTGHYILKVSRGNQVSYLPIVISNHAMIVQYSQEEVIGITQNSNTGNFVPNLKYNIYFTGKLVESRNSDAQGIVKFPIHSDSAYTENILLRTEYENEVIFDNSRFWFLGKSKNEVYSYIFTNQPIYRPGSMVYLKGMFTEEIKSILTPYKGRDFELIVTSPNKTEILNRKGKTNNFGTLADSVFVPAVAEVGYYTITIKTRDEYYTYNFKVEEFKKPEFVITSKSDKNNYVVGETATITINTAYYFGAPLRNAKIELALKETVIRDYPFYTSYKSYPYSHDSKDIALLQGVTDNFGNCTFQFVIPKNGSNKNNSTITGKARSFDENQNQLLSEFSFQVYSSDLTLSVSSDRYYCAVNENINFIAKLKKLDGAPSSQDIGINITRLDYVDGNTVESAEGTFNIISDKFGLGYFSYSPKKGGYYKFKFFAADSKGNLTENEFGLYVSELGYSFRWPSMGNLNTILNKTEYVVGDTLKALFLLPDSDKDILVTLAQKNIFLTEKIRAKGSTAEFVHIIKPNEAPNIELSLSYFSGSQMMTEKQSIKIIDPNQFITINVQPNIKKPEPSVPIKYTLHVTDATGKPVRNAELSFSSIDESLFALANYSQNIFSQFTRNTDRYNPTNFSRSIDYSNVMSRNEFRFERGEKIYYPEFANAPNGDLKVKFFTSESNSYFKNLLKNSYFILAADSIVKIIPVDTEGVFTVKNLTATTKYELGYVTEQGYSSFFGDILIYPNFISEYRFEIPLHYYTRTLMADKGGDTYRMSENTMNNPATPKDESKPLKIREIFKDAAYWMPNIYTDDNGDAAINFTLPDNLTSWRVTVNGVTENFKFGEAVINTQTSKELMVRLDTPRFIRERDTVTVTSTIHNETDEKLSVNVNCDIVGGTLKYSYPIAEKNVVKSNEANYIVTLEPRSSTVINWVIGAPKFNESVSVKCVAIAKDKSDGIKVNIPILPYGVNVQQYLYSTIYDVEKVDSLQFFIADTIDLRTAKLEISTLPTLTATLLNSLETLVDYPYGCVEQTMSRFLPAIVVQNTLKLQGLRMPESLEKKLPDVIEKGLQKLYSMQNRDGSWGWWMYDSGNAELTAYVVNGLSMAQKAGNSINEMVYKAGVERLKDYCLNDSLQSPETKAYIGYVLANATLPNSVSSDDAKAHILKNLQIEEKEELSPLTLALSGLTAVTMEKEKLATTYGEVLVKKAKVSANYASWESEYKYYNWKNDDNVTSSYALQLLVALEPQNELVRKTVSYLTVKKQGGYWNSTMQTAMVIFGLNSYLSATKELNPDFDAKVTLNGSNVIEKHFGKESVFATDNTINLDFSSGKLKHGINKVFISKKGKGTLYSPVTLQFFNPNPCDCESKEFTVNRCYSLVEQEQDEKGYDYELKKPRYIKKGDILLVTLNIEPSSLANTYVMIEDMLPAGFEVIEDRQNESIDIMKKLSADYPDILANSYIHKEVRDSKVSFFINYLSNNGIKLRYLIRARFPGLNNAMPTEAQLMYYPEIKAYSEPTILEVNKK